MNESSLWGQYKHSRGMVYFHTTPPDSLLGRGILRYDRIDEMIRAIGGLHERLKKIFDVSTDFEEQVNIGFEIRRLQECRVFLQTYPTSIESTSELVQTHKEIAGIGDALKIFEVAYSGRFKEAAW